MASELDYNTTAASNSAINGVGITGNDLPSNLDNALREVMAGTANSQPRATLKDANYTAVKDDFGKTFVFSGASRTLTVSDISTLATGWNIYAEADATNALTIARSGSNTLNGKTSLTLPAGCRCHIFVSDSATDVKVDFLAPAAMIDKSGNILNFAWNNSKIELNFGTYWFGLGDGALKHQGALIGRSFVTSYTADIAWGFNVADAGAKLLSDETGVGYLAATANASPSLYLKRLNSGTIASFREMTNLTVGSISITGSATAYNTSSDVRLKEDFQPINPALLDAIKVYDFQWRSDGSRAYGVKAQELVDILPQAVHQGDEGDFWSVDYSKLVPLLIASLQDARDRLRRLEGEVSV